MAGLAAGCLLATGLFAFGGAALAFVGVAALSVFTAPFLLPNLRPLRDDTVKADAATIAIREHLPKVKVEVQDVHNLTTAPNAESAGLGPTRVVVLWDTLFHGRFTRREYPGAISRCFARWLSTRRSPSGRPCRSRARRPPPRHPRPSPRAG